jgi:digeranylgeranylglycerophospholipid reductase
MKSAYDVIVVGAGPAGSAAARVAAQAGLDVLLIEKRQEIGSLVRCAEAVGVDSLAPYIEPDPRWVNAEIDFYAVHNSLGDSVAVPPTEPTLVVERKIFDRELARLAAEAGATVRAKTAAVGVLRENGAVTGVEIKYLGRSYKVAAKLVVAADGTESQVARWAGIDTTPPLVDYYSGAQFLLSGVGDKVKPRECQYHFDFSIATGGYVWVFPKGNNTANVGLVITGVHATEESAISRLERFVEKHFPDAGVLSVVLGGIPVTRALKQMVTDGLMVVGDAAHQAEPLTGGGICLGVIGGDMAMQAGVEAIREGDVSARRLRAYEKNWQKRNGRELAALYRVRKLLAKIDQDRIDELVKTASEMPIQEMSLGAIALRLFANHPRLLAEAGLLVASGFILK